jgi:hypothetical protein
LCPPFDDWAARKAAAEALAFLALEHGDDLISHKSSCHTVFVAKRFDKVGHKYEVLILAHDILVAAAFHIFFDTFLIVCESMNWMIESWPEI